jgi:hypothetical protein
MLLQAQINLHKVNELVSIVMFFNSTIYTGMWIPGHFVKCAT